MKMTTTKILVIGAAGQIGVELTLALRGKYGADNVFASDVSNEPPALDGTGPWFTLNALHAGSIQSVIIREGITEVYLLAAMLSATGEAKPIQAWELNMQSLINVLEVAREEKVRVFWPSSIAAHAPSSTVYGLSKQAGEYWCEYYFNRYGVDVRSLRYPGLISYKTAPGGGTTDYAIDIFHAAVDKRVYKCFLREDTLLPMMYMEDAIRATMMLMEAPMENILNRQSYDVCAMSFTPQELAESIRAFCPSFQIEYAPDHRQRIADSWQNMKGDIEAREDWNWRPKWSLTMMVNDMLLNVEQLKMNTISGKLEKQGVL